jgi:hypothetical protein
VKYVDESEELSFIESPYYSYVPENEKVERYGNSKFRYAALSDRKVLTVNMGIQREGFDVCTKCGGAEIAIPGVNVTISQPYHDHNVCSHQGTLASNVFLGFRFLTDMFMLDIEYDANKLVGLFSSDEKKIFWSAATTLNEALKKSISLVLDIDYNELNGGWLPRIVSNEKLHIEMYFYDNLSSGAGYSSMVDQYLEEILDTAQKILEDCKCSRTCKNCLDNFWNQKNHSYFDRKLGMQLLNYARFGSYPESLPENEQKLLLAPLEKLIAEDRDLPNNEKIEFEVIPALRKKPISSKEKMFLNPYDLSDWLPNTFITYKNLLSQR